MKLAHRIGYYLGGFAIGIVILMFFLSGKRTSCDYGPDARVLKNIRLKKRTFNEAALITMKSQGIDTSHISTALKVGDVLFSESDTNKDSCNIYAIKYKTDEKTIKFKAENCSKIATISNIEVIN